ncbi:MAG: DNA polymerase III subunit epsilon [Chitinophagaceae bacterium]
MYAIVDIETTGGYASANGITEISIHVFDGEKVVDKFETLINPCQPIPYYIQSMTGITNEMVSEAPLFEDVAKEVYEMLNEKVFVAHNVNFDYSFIKNHLQFYGYELNCKKLCTVRLSRKIFPGFASYSLGNLCHSLGIQMSARHRAGGDAAATVEVFHRLLKHDHQQNIVKSLQRNSKEQMLPPNVPKEDFEKLPHRPGVYYFHNQKGKVVYVGKARDIHNRVNSHFSNNSDSRQKQNFLRHVYNISFQTCATELMACILESSEIKRLWPEFNYSQKRWEDVYGIFCYEDQNGYLRLAIEKNKKQLNAVYHFHYLVEGHAVVRKLIAEYQLCPRLCFMQHASEPCTGDCRGACRQQEDAASYNLRVEEAITSLQQQPSFAIVDRGLHKDDQSFILVINGKFYGMGYVPADVQLTDAILLKNYVQPYKENSYIRNLVHSFASRYPSKVIPIHFSSAIESFHQPAFD